MYSTGSIFDQYTSHYSNVYGWLQLAVILPDTHTNNVRLQNDAHLRETLTRHFIGSHRVDLSLL